MHDEGSGGYGGRVRALCFDGGPTPFVTLRMLYRAERWSKRELGRSVIERVNLFSGTSDGAIIALFLAKKLADGLSGEEALARCIAFTGQYLSAFTVLPSNLARAASLVRPLFDGRALREMLYAAFGDTTLGDLSKEHRDVTVLAFDAEKWEQTTYHSFDPGADPAARLFEVALASASMPVMMPAFRSQQPNYDPATGRGVADPADGKVTPRPRGSRAILDGAVVANNPVMAVVADAVLRASWHDTASVERSVNNEFRCNGGAARYLPRVTVLSLGARPYTDGRRLLRHRLVEAVERHARGARVPERIADPPITRDVSRFEGAEQTVLIDYGILQWATYQFPLGVLNLFLQGNADYSHRHAQQLLGIERYHRVEPELEIVDLFTRLTFAPYRFGTGRRGLRRLFPSRADVARSHEALSAWLDQEADRLWNEALMKYEFALPRDPPAQSDACVVPGGPRVPNADRWNALTNLPYWLRHQWFPDEPACDWYPHEVAPRAPPPVSGYAPAADPDEAAGGR
jgi:predicted acylesterase/phospholipase RssA